MHIISGKYKGRQIKMPKGIMPTQNKVRKALFDILGDINGCFFLELFAGSGAVGLEALSQGARGVVFVENDRMCIKLIQENLNSLKSQVSSLRSTYGSAASDAQHVAMIINKDVLDAIKVLHRDKKEFDIIFADPPYYQGLALRLRSVPRMSAVESLAKKTLQTISCYDILAPNGIIAVQHFKKDMLPDRLGVLTLFRQARYGDTVLSFYKRSSL